MNELLRSAVSALAAERSLSVNCCCCFGRGSANLKVHVGKSHYVAGEVADIVCDIVNDSTEVFTYARVKLMRRLHLRSNGWATKTFDDVVSEMRYDGIGPNTRRTGEAAMHIPLQLQIGIWPSVRARLITYDVSLALNFFKR